MGGGHANVRGLNKFGVVMIEELMAHGILIDVDHMSEKALDAALAMVEAVDYPVMCSHTWFRDLLYSADVDMDEPGWDDQYGTDDVQKVAHEAGKRGDQVEKIAKLGGIVAPIINQGDMAGLKRTMPELAKKIPVHVHGFEHGVGAGVPVHARQDGRSRGGDRHGRQRRGGAARPAVRALRRVRREGRCAGA